MPLLPKPCRFGRVRLLVPRHLVKRCDVRGCVEGGNREPAAAINSGRIALVFRTTPSGWMERVRTARYHDSRFEKARRGVQCAAVSDALSKLVEARPVRTGLVGFVSAGRRGYATLGSTRSLCLTAPISSSRSPGCNRLRLRPKADRRADRMARSDCPGAALCSGDQASRQWDPSGGRA